jgi:porphobilinogen synthase
VIKIIKHKTLAKIQRLRRLRSSESLLSLIAETTLNIHDLVYPLFVKPGSGIKEEILSMPGQFRHTLSSLQEEIETIRNCGIKAVLLFGLAGHKDEKASESYDPQGPVQAAIRLFKKNAPEIVVMTDVCVCGYTSHGHCGILKEGKIVNDESLELLQQMALSHVQAGADVVAPSAMMDGQVAAIREILDANGYSDTSIMGYSAKYFSSCYGPFRDAADSAPQTGNRSSYQMNIGNSKEALREIKADEAEGADILMVKPAALYLDILAKASQITDLPIAAYNVSGEYSMIKAAAEKGWIDEKRVMMEMLVSIKRAGASLIITYFAKDAAIILKG